MNASIRHLLAAGAAAALLAAPAARTRACDDLPIPPYPAPPAAFPRPLPAPPAPAVVVAPAGWGPRWGDPRAALEAETWRLTQARERFYAGWRGDPWAQRRFESWYAARRAELDRRAAWLAEREEWYAGRHPRAEGEWAEHRGWRERHERDDD